MFDLSKCTIFCVEIYYLLGLKTKLCILKHFTCRKRHAALSRRPFEKDKRNSGVFGFINENTVPPVRGWSDLVDWSEMSKSNVTDRIYVLRPEFAFFVQNSSTFICSLRGIFSKLGSFYRDKYFERATYYQILYLGTRW